MDEIDDPAKMEPERHPPLGLSFVTNERIPCLCGPNDFSMDEPYADREDYLYAGKLVGNPKFDIHSADGLPDLTIAYPVAEPSYPRITLARLWEMLRQLPDIRLVHRLMVIDGTHEEEAWIKQTTGNPGLTIQATTDAFARITLYRPWQDQAVDAAIQHEWCHLLKFASPKESKLFDDIGSLEPVNLDEFLGNTAGAWSVQSDEIWATFGEAVLQKITASKRAEILLIAGGLPIKAAIWGRALENRLATVDRKSDHHDSYAQVAGWLANIGGAEAIEKLEATARTNTDGDRIDRLLSFLKEPAELTRATWRRPFRPGRNRPIPSETRKDRSSRLSNRRFRRRVRFCDNRPARSTDRQLGCSMDCRHGIKVCARG